MKTTHVPSKDRDGLQDADIIEYNENARQILLNAARDVPEVRTEKVKTIKKQIEEGTYRIDSRAVAEKILEQLGR